MITPKVNVLRGLAARATTPPLPDDYLKLLNPLWTARELRGERRWTQRDGGLRHGHDQTGLGILGRLRQRLQMPTQRAPTTTGPGPTRTLEKDELVGVIEGVQVRGERRGYAATKAAIANFAASLAQMLGTKGMRVNSVAPGPIWTPLIPSTMPSEKVIAFGDDVPLGRAGQPAEFASAYVLQASDDGSYISGARLAVTGGRPVL